MQTAVMHWFKPAIVVEERSVLHLLAVEAATSPHAPGLPNAVLVQLSASGR